MLLVPAEHCEKEAPLCECPTAVSHPLALTLGGSRSNTGHTLGLRHRGNPPQASDAPSMPDRPGDHICDSDAACWTGSSKQNSVTLLIFLLIINELTGISSSSSILKYLFNGDIELTPWAPSPWWTSPAGRPCRRAAGCRESSSCGPVAGREAGTLTRRPVSVFPSSSDPCCLRMLCVWECCLHAPWRQHWKHAVINSSSSSVWKCFLWKTGCAHLQKTLEIRFELTTERCCLVQGTGAARPGGWWLSLECEYNFLLEMHPRGRWPKFEDTIFVGVGVHSNQF